MIYIRLIFYLLVCVRNKKTIQISYLAQSQLYQNRQIKYIKFTHD